MATTDASLVFFTAASTLSLLEAAISWGLESSKLILEAADAPRVTSKKSLSLGVPVTTIPKP